MRKHGMVHGMFAYSLSSSNNIRVAGVEEEGKSACYNCSFFILQYHFLGKDFLCNNDTFSLAIFCNNLQAYDNDALHIQSQFELRDYVAKCKEIIISLALHHLS